MLPKAFNKVFLLFVLQMHFIDCHLKLSKASNKTRKSRPKRALYFTFYGGYALDCLISLPLDLPANNAAFSAFLFSTNFFYPSFDNTDGLIPLPFAYILEPGVNAGSFHRNEYPPANRQFNDNGAEKGDEMDSKNATSVETLEIEGKSSKKKKRKEKKGEKRSKKARSVLNNYFMSRRRFYKMLETNMNTSGLNGNYCVLKAICEASEASFGYNNGVIGSIVDVLFLPSASKDEYLPKKYYQAETNGKSRNCSVYSELCPKSIFDFISKII